jgi:2-methylcitrate dehydratase
MSLSSRKLAEFALDTSVDDFDDDVVAQTELRVLDSLGCVLGALDSPPSETLRTCYGDRTGGPSATVLGTGESLSVEYAALVNSTMVRYLDFNDCYVNGYGGSHPSDHIPALVSVAEAVDASGRELIEAIVVAYEIQCRGMATGAVYEHDFDAQAVWGSYSATAAVGKLMGLSVDELVDALGICGASHNGLLIARRGDVSMWKGAAVPYAIHGAVQACQMAESGMTGPEKLFEGPGGVFEVVSRDDVDLPLAEDGYEITRTNIKPYAGCYHALPAVTGILELLERNGVSAADLDAVELDVYETAYRTCATEEKWGREMTRETADHSLPYVVAVAALEGDLRPEHYSPEWLASDEVHDLVERISVTVDDDLTARRRRGDGLTPTRVRLVAGGETVETVVEYPLGHYERPLTDDEVETKVRTLVEPHLTDEWADRLVGGCRTLRDQSDLHELLASVTA